MWHEVTFARELFKQLAEMDELIADAVEAGGCQHCGGPLYRADYQRKPRGGLFAAAGEAFRRRPSLCCGREGCRKRALPPSLRYLGRRVYLEVVVLIATVQAMLARTLRAACEITGVPARTLRRWQAWWIDDFPKRPEWTVMRSLFVPPPPDERELPKSLLERFAAEVGDGPASDRVLELAARWLAPVTTRSVPDGSRFVRAAVAREVAQKMAFELNFRAT
jgi:hypothetical protein